MEQYERNVLLDDCVCLDNSDNEFMVVCIGSDTQKSSTIFRNGISAIHRNNKVEKPQEIYGNNGWNRIDLFFGICPYD
jgi:hypothetical protein